MKISEYIERLKEARNKYSDIDIKIDDDILYVQVKDYFKCRLSQIKSKEELSKKVDDLIQYVTARLTIDTETADWLFVKERIIDTIKEIWK